MSDFNSEANNLLLVADNLRGHDDSVIEVVIREGAKEIKDQQATIDKLVEGLSFLVTEIDFAYDKDKPVLIYSGKLDECRALINSVTEGK